MERQSEDSSRDGAGWGATQSSARTLSASERYDLKEIQLPQAAESSDLVKLAVHQNKTATVSIGSAEEAIISFSPERLLALHDCLNDIETKIDKGEIRRLVISSEHPRMFAAGADLTQLAEVSSYQSAHDFIRFGQLVFERFSELPVPKVAAVHGTCLGGALELALRCDAIVASDSLQTELGLPEVKLGLIPGWGGSTILPQKIGLRAALAMMLKGTSKGSKAALEIGLVDKVTSKEELGEAAEELAKAIESGTQQNRPLPVIDQLIHKIPFLQKQIKKITRKTVSRGHSDHYIAPKEIIAATFFGLRKERAESLKNEAATEAKLILGRQCPNLVGLFFKSEAAKGLGKKSNYQFAGKNVEVTGAGIMGAGIAAAMCKAGANVDLLDLSEDVLKSAEERIANTVERSRKLSTVEKKARLQSVRYEKEPQSRGQDLYLEGVPEIPKLKTKILAQISERAPSDAIIVTNTSSLSVSELAKSVENPSRFAGLHYFSPVEKMPLVEIIRGEETSQETVDRLAAIASAQGKLPVVVENVPGFLVNRLLGPYMTEALTILSEGRSISEIDKAAKDFGMPMGPMMLLDKVGLDTALHVAQELSRAYPDRVQLGPAFVGLKQSGLLGEKSGKGLYVHPLKKGKRPLPNKELQDKLVQGQVLTPIPLEKRRIQERLILSLVNEAVRSLDEGVAGREFPKNAEQIDLASTTGFGFAPFHGGLIRFAQSLGPKRVLELLERLEKDHGERFKAAPGIVARAKSGKSFYEEQEI